MWEAMEWYGENNFDWACMCQRDVPSQGRYIFRDKMLVGKRLILITLCVICVQLVLSCTNDGEVL